MMSLLTQKWMDLKVTRSKKHARKEREPLPAFRTVQELSDYIQRNFIFTGDAIGGLDDRYEHPECLNYFIVKNLREGRYGTDRDWPLRVDCDDVSVFAYHAAMKIPNVISATMVVLVYPSVFDVIKSVLRDLVRFKKPYLYFHEGCLIETTDGDFFLDTNGLMTIKDARWWCMDEDDLLDYIENSIGKQYGVKYALHRVEYPFF